MPTVNIDVDVDYDVEDFSPSEQQEIALEFAKNDPSFILELFNPLNGSELDRALQAIRDRSAHDLQMLLS